MKELGRILRLTSYLSYRNELTPRKGFVTIQATRVLLSESINSSPIYTFAGGRFRFCSACALFFAESVAYFRGRPRIDISYKNELQCKSKWDTKHACTSSVNRGMLDGGQGRSRDIM